MKKPEIKLVDYNTKKPNIQNKGTHSTGVPNGRMVVSIKEVKTFGFKGKGAWLWDIKYDNFQIGTHTEHNETWGKDNEHRKLGGIFPLGYYSAKFYFEVSREFTSASGIKTFTWKFEWTQMYKFKEIKEEEVTPVPIPKPKPEPEPIEINPIEPAPKKFSKTPFAAFSAKSKIVIFLQAILYWKNYKMIMSHAFGGFLEDLECLTAEWKGLIRMNLQKMLNNALRYEIYLLPVKSEDQIQKAEALLSKMLNAKYNRYKHFLWYLNTKTLDAVLLTPIIAIFGIGYLKIYLLVIGIIYIPVRMYLKYLSKKSFDCIHALGEFALCFDTDIYGGEKKDSQSPDEACEKFRFANKATNNKAYPLYGKK